jgi:hypothetical protein
MKVVIAYADLDSELATSRWRCFIPAQALFGAGHEVKLIHINSLVHTDLGGVDAVLAERTLNTPRINHVRKWPCKLVFTFDDAYTKLPGYAHVLMYWRRAGGIEEFRVALKESDLNIVPSHALINLYRRGSAPFEFVPNFMSRERWSRIDWDAERSDKIVIGWGGSSNHWESFSMSGVAEALKKISSKHDVEIRINAHPKTKMVSSLRVRHVPIVNYTVPWAEWPSEMASWDIAIAPAVGDYDLYRSRLRIIESGLAKVPYIASDYGPYAGQDKGGILVANGKKSWYRGLTRLIEDEDARDRLGSSGHDWASGYYMDDNVKVYEDILFG